MTILLGDVPDGHRRRTIPTIWVALAASVLVHVALLLFAAPRLQRMTLPSPDAEQPGSRLVVALAPASTEAAAVPPPVPTAPPPLRSMARQAPVAAVKTLPPPEAPAPKPAMVPPVVTPVPAPVREAPAPRPPPPPSEPPVPVVEAPPSPVAAPPPPPVPAPPTPPAPQPQKALPAPSLAPEVLPTTPPAPRPAERPVAAAPAQPPQVQGDLSAYIEARRRARGETGSVSAETRPSDGQPANRPRDDESARRDRVIAENLGLNRTPTFGSDNKGGGIFEIEYVGRDSAAFLYFGWNKDIQRNSKQLIEVERGNNPDIRIAVVRRMIALIRTEVVGDFMWVSQRRGNVPLSSRPEDNAELEAFMMNEFFGPRR